MGSQVSAGVFWSTTATSAHQCLTPSGLAGTTFKSKSNTETRGPLSQFFYNAGVAPRRKSQAVPVGP